MVQNKVYNELDHDSMDHASKAGISLPYFLVHCLVRSGLSKVDFSRL